MELNRLEERNRVRILVYWLLGGALTFGLGVMILKEPLLDRVRDYRAESLYQEAREAFEAELWEESSRKGNAAHYLSPDRRDIALLVGRALWKQRMQTSIRWWEMVLNEPDLPVDELREIVEVLLATGQIGEGLKFLSRLVELDEGSEATYRLWLRALDAQRRMSGVYELAGSLAHGGTEDWEVHARYINLEQRTGSEGERRAVEHLLRLNREGGGLAKFAAREILATRSATSEERVEAAQALKAANPSAIEALLAESALYAAGKADRAEVIALAENIATEGEGESRFELARWAEWMGESAWYVDNVAFKDIRGEGPVMMKYFELMLRSNRERDLLALIEREFQLENEHAPLMLFFRSQALAALGQELESERALTLAVQTTRWEQLNQLERLLLLGGRHDKLLDLYLQFEKDRGHLPLYQQKLLATLYYLGRTDQLSQWLERVSVESFSGNPALIPFILYMRLATTGDASELHREIETHMVEYPEVFDYRLVLGLSYQIQGMAEVGRALVAEIPQLDMNAPRYLRVCVIALGKGSSQRLIRTEEWENLLPREILWISQSVSSR